MPQGPTIDELSPEFCQGARCGHLEGAHRAGQYVIGEEYLPSEEAAEAQGLQGNQVAWWAAGYRYGYKLRAEGESLPEVITRLPVTPTWKIGDELLLAYGNGTQRAKVVSINKNGALFLSRCYAGKAWAPPAKTPMRADDRRILSKPPTDQA